MSLTKVARVESVSIVRRDAKLYLRYTLDGKTRLESTGSDALPAAKKMARGRWEELKRIADLGLSTGRKLVKTAITEAIATFSQSRSDEHKHNMSAACNYFCDWLTEEYHSPNVYWHEVTPAILREYVNAMAGRELAPRTMRLYLNPILVASRYMAELDPKAFRPLTITHSALRVEKVEKNYLDAAQLDSLLKTAEEISPAAETAVLLCGYCGLRIWEAERLQPSDTVGDTITVRNGKNNYSERCIPVTAWVSKRLISQRGEWDVSRLIQSALNRAKIDTIVPRDLRKTFVNMAIDAGCRTEFIQAYCGQRPSSILAQHYGDFSNVERLRSEIVSKMWPK